MPSDSGYWNNNEAEVNHDFSEGLAKWISKYLNKKETINDFGAGKGQYVKFLQDKGFNAWAIEGDISTVTETDSKIEKDLTEPFELIDIGNSICLEVGEHIPEDYANVLFYNLVRNTKGKLIISWAIPGQDGYGHVNCRYNTWVIGELKKRGFKLLAEDSFKAREATEERFGYFKNTILVFKMLDKVGIKYGTDKSSVHHNFLDIYEQYLSPLKDKNISLIECGVGGYEYLDRGGESIRMWYEYLPNAKLIGIDKHNKTGIANDRTEFWQGSQIDRGLLSTIIDREKNAEQRIFIDDASHNNKLTIETFKIVFPLLKNGDLYFVEDVHSSYWDDDEYEGHEVPGAKGTTMEFFTRLTHQMNAQHLKELYHNEFTGMIEFIHFYKEIIVIKKLQGARQLKPKT